jgi:hypothetical protein
MIENNNWKGHTFTKNGTFKDKFDFAAKKQEQDILLIKSLFPDLDQVQTCSDYQDRKGGDYAGINEEGLHEYIDIKRREPGSSKYWKRGPEVAIELESVVTGGKYNIPEGRIGWTLDDKKQTDWIIYAFDPSDSPLTFHVPFQVLKDTVKEHLEEWKTKHRVFYQDSGQWQSSAMFIPLYIIEQLCRETWVKYTNM